MITCRFQYFKTARDPSGISVSDWKRIASNSVMYRRVGTMIEAISKYHTCEYKLQYDLKFILRKRGVFGDFPDISYVGELGT